MENINDQEKPVCPYCGHTALIGATRCTKCGKIIKSAEEQRASMEKLQESKKVIDLRSLINLIIFIIAAVVIFYFFSDRIIEFIKKILGGTS